MNPFIAEVTGGDCLFILFLLSAVAAGVWWAVHHKAQVDVIVAKGRAEEQLLLAKARSVEDTAAASIKSLETRTAALFASKPQVLRQDIPANEPAPDEPGAV